MSGPASPAGTPATNGRHLAGDDPAFLRELHGLAPTVSDRDALAYHEAATADFLAEQAAELARSRLDEVRRAIGAAPGPSALAPLGVCLADVEAEPIRWAWPGWLALGKLHVFDGDPGMGKSTLLASLAASVTTGAPWPDGRPVPTPARGGAVILTAEDDPAATIRPRMEAAGADVARVSVVSTIPTDKGHGRIPAFPGDVDLIVRECRRLGARLLVVDPVTAYLGDVNSHRDSDVRGALAPLAAEAEAAGVAVVLVRHLNKSAGGSALYRGGGSIAFTGLARVAWIAGKDPASPDRRALAVSKNNLAAFPQAQGYELVSAGPLGVGKVAWTGPLPLSADDLVRPVTLDAATPAQDEAADFILAALADGPRPARELYAEAEAAGITEASMKRARKRLGVETERRGGFGGSGGWYWLPLRPKELRAQGPELLSEAAPRRQAENGPHGTAEPKELTPSRSLEAASSLASRELLSEAAELAVGATVLTPGGRGVVTAPPAGGRVSVDLGGLPTSFAVADVTPDDGSAPT